MINDGLIFFRNQLFIPDYEDLLFETFYRTHSSGPAIYPGRFKALDLLHRTYWWPQMSSFHAKLVKCCDLYF